MRHFYLALFIITTMIIGATPTQALVEHSLSLSGGNTTFSEQFEPGTPINLGWIVQSDSGLGLWLSGGYLFAESKTADVADYQAWHLSPQVAYFFGNGRIKPFVAAGGSILFLPADFTSPAVLPSYRAGVHYRPYEDFAVFLSLSGWQHDDGKADIDLRASTVEFGVSFVLFSPQKLSPHHGKKKQYFRPKKRNRHPKHRREFKTTFKRKLYHDQQRLERERIQEHNRYQALDL